MRISLPRKIWLPLIVVLFVLSLTGNPVAIVTLVASLVFTGISRMWNAGGGSTRLGGHQRVNDKELVGGADNHSDNAGDHRAGATSSGPFQSSVNAVPMGGRKLGVLILIAVALVYALISALVSPNSSDAVGNPIYTAVYVSGSGTAEAYNCPKNKLSAALALRPGGQTDHLRSEWMDLELRDSELTTRKHRPPLLFVDRLNKSSVYEYNAAVDKYNADLAKLKSDVASWDQRRSSYDGQVDAYNKYLEGNCSPAD